MNFWRNRLTFSFGRKDVPLLNLLPVGLVVLENLVDLRDKVLLGALVVKLANVNARFRVVVAMLFENSHLELVAAHPETSSVDDAFSHFFKLSP